ncbi:MAG: Flp pilus assembly protein CpaB [Bryobacteraceae bacterium]
MNRRVSTILLFAFVVAAIASYLVYRVAGAQRRAVGPETMKIVVAARDLEIGTVIRDEDVKVGEWVGAVPKGLLVAKEAIVGRGVISQLYEGEPIRDNRLAAVGSGGGLAATIRPGMRACAIRVNDVVGVAGFVVPGMRVDVLIAGNGPGASNADGPRVKTLLQNIEVLSAGTNIQKDNEGKPVQVPVVNLLVTPEQAQILSLASNETRIQLVLRNPLDTDTPKTSTVAMASLFSDGATKPAPALARKVSAPPVQTKAPDPRVFLIEVFNGSKRSQEKFNESETQHQ